MGFTPPLNGASQEYFTFSPVPNTGSGAPVTAVTGSGNILSSGGTTPNITNVANPTFTSLTVVGGIGANSLAITTPLSVADGGTGTATPNLVAGTNVTITGSWPDQTINASGGGSGTITAVTASSPISSSGGTTPNITITSPLPVANGGTATATPSLVAGTNTTVSGTWPAQAVNVATGAGGVTSVTASSPLASSGGTTPSISITSPLPITNGGTATATPSLVSGTNTTVSGTWPAQAVNLVSAPSISGANLTSGTVPNTSLVTAPVTSVTASGNLSSSGGTTPAVTITATPVFTTLESKANGSIAAYCPPIYDITGAITSATEHIVRGYATISVGSGQTQASAAVILTNSAIFSSSTSYQVVCSLSTTGSTMPASWSYTNTVTFVQHFSNSVIAIFADNSVVSTGTGTLVVDFIAIGT